MEDFESFELLYAIPMEDLLEILYPMEEEDWLEIFYFILIVTECGTILLICLANLCFSCR